MSEEIERLRGGAVEIGRVRVLDVLPLPPEDDTDALEHVQAIAELEEKVKIHRRITELAAKVRKQLDKDLAVYGIAKRRGEHSGEKQTTIPVEGGHRGPRKASP